jgi:hypothetical protein
LLLLFGFPAAASAEVQTIDFDTGMVNSPLDGQGDISFPTNLGFRPYLTGVGIRAHSGANVGDLGRCAEEVDAAGGNAGDCELFQAHTTATLTRTAKSVTLFAGRFGPVGPLDAPEQATLTAFDAGQNEIVTTGPVAIDANGFNTRLSVASAAGNIASFTVKATSGPAAESTIAGDLGIDNLSVEFADGGAPDLSLSSTTQVLALVQGQQLEVPVHTTRLNGSNGPIQLSLSGLPQGVSAAPVTVPGSSTTATLTLVAAPNAADTNFAPAEATLTATPLEASAGPAPRTAPLFVRVAKDFELSAEGPGGVLSHSEISIEAPDCAPVDLPVKISRDIAMNRDITLSLRSADFDATGLPPGVSAEILPSPVIHPGGNLTAERTIRFRADASAELGLLQFVLEARIGDSTEPSHRLRILMLRAHHSTSIDAASVNAMAPRYGREGSRVLIHGNGFCAGTVIEVGNSEAELPTTLVDDHTIEFTVPRYATTGRPVIFPAGKLSPYRIQDTLNVDHFRNVDGFQFENYDSSHLSQDEFTRAFGADDVMISVNPCWPFGSCRIEFMHPTAFLEWELWKDISGGHCFGISLASQDFFFRKLHYAPYADPDRKNASNAFEMSGPDAPGYALESLIDVEHVKQFSDEFVMAWMGRDSSLLGQLQVLEKELGRNRPVLLSMEVKSYRDDFVSEGHTLLAYDMKPTANGADIYVYDSNRPFTAGEAINGLLHRRRIDATVVHVDLVKGKWTYKMVSGDVWYGGNKDSLWATPLGTIPSDPSLPGIGTAVQVLGWYMFNPTDGLVQPVLDGDVPEPEAMPIGDAGSARSRGMSWVSRNPDRPFKMGFVGVKAGHYTQSYVVPGFAAAAIDVPIQKGIRDTVTGDGETLSLASGQARALKFELTRESGTAATLETHASADGTDRAGFAGDGDLTYAHQGDPTTLRFSLTTVRRDGGPATFVSGPLALDDGDHLRVTPLDRGLHRVRLELRDANGRKHIRVLQNRSRSAGKVRLGAPKLRGHRLSMRFRLSGFGRRAIAGATMRLMRGGRLIAHRSLALKHASAKRKLGWRLPRSLKRGGYRLLVDVRAIAVGSRDVTASRQVNAHRSERVRVG